jgi:radical SAM protein with 4Fe4S-binding SPASM domain
LRWTIDAGASACRKDASTVKMPKRTVLMYEVSGDCNCRCVFCYNAWKIGGDRRTAELGTGRALALLEKAIDETGCESITLSGGEPLLRNDIFEIISCIKKRNVSVSLVSNGALLTDETIDRCISSGVDRFQITLLSDDRGQHDRLSGCATFERAIEAILNIKKRGGAVYTFFVGLADNIDRFGGTLELNALLDVRTVALGRFVPGGTALAGWEAYMPAPDAIDRALAAGDAVCGKYGMTISVSTPLLPCINDVTGYRRIRPSFCGVGDAGRALFALDPLGNLKVCSHSPVSLGNLLEEPFERLLESEFLDRFIEAVPPFCRDCPDLSPCRGGCRSSAHLCYGSVEAEDPYLRHWRDRARKPDAPHFGGSDAAEIRRC